MQSKDTVIIKALSWFQDIFDGATTSNAVMLLDGSFAGANTAFRSLAMLDDVQLQSRKLQDLVHPDDIPEIQRGFDDCLAGTRTTFRLVHKIGDPARGYRSVDSNFAMLRDPENQAACFVCQSIDITDEMVTWDIMRRTRDTLKLALEVNKIGTWDHDLRTEEMVLDERAEEIFGYAPGQYPEIDFSEHVKRHYPIELTDFERKVLEPVLDPVPPNPETGFSFRLRKLACLGGGYIWAKLGERFLFDAETKQRTNIFGTIQDVTDETERQLELAHAQRQLTENEKFLNQATKGGGIALWRVEDETGNCWYNDTWFQILGYEPDELEHNLDMFYGLVHPDDVKKLQASHPEKQNDEPFAVDFRMRKKDGTYTWISSWGSRISRKDEGLPDVFCGSQRDISDKMRAQRTLEETLISAETARQRLNILADNIPGGLFAFRKCRDGTFHFPYFSAGFAKMHGTKPEEIEKSSPCVFRHLLPNDAERLRKEIATLDETAPLLTAKYRIDHPELGLRWLQTKSAPYRSDTGEVTWYGSAFDVTEDILKTQELDAARKLNEHQARHDSLTGLPNRRYFDEALRDREMSPDRRNRTITIIRVDLDHFKYVNDTLGHAAGDAVLVHVGEVLMSCTRAADLVARVGGDEFVILMEARSTDADAVELVDRIRARILKPLLHEGRYCRFGASFGIASVESNGDKSTELLSFADTALYQAKQAGRGRMQVFTPEMHVQMMHARKRADEIQEAMEQDRFIPFFQPQIDTRTGEIAGFEVLARWDHPERGILPPSEFIEIAEQIKIVADVDRTIFQKAIDILHDLNLSGLHIPKLSFNISAGRIHDPGIVDSVEQIRGLNTRVGFELLESILLEKEGGAFEYHLDRLKELGIDIEVDDFGSGRASIVGVMRVAPDTLKIDQRLVVPIIESEKAQGLIRAIVDIGKSLGISVTAEGVETLEHAAILRDMGCDTLQGYAFARPMPPDRLPEYITAYKPSTILLPETRRSA